MIFSGVNAVKEYRFGEEKQDIPELTEELIAYLGEGFRRLDGRMPLFDHEGNWFSPETVEAAEKEGWVEPAYEKQILKASKIMRLTKEGREVFEAATTC